MKRVGLIALTILTSCMYKAVIEDVPVGPNLYYPMSDFANRLLSNPDDYKLTSVYYSGQGGASTTVYANFGYSTDGQKWGRFYQTPTSVGVERMDVPGPCVGTGTAPNCEGTWGGGSTGRYRADSIVIYPNLSNNQHTWSKISVISAEIKITLATGNFAPGGTMAACGLSLGLGEKGGVHQYVSGLPTSLNVANRGSYGDQIVMGYYIEPSNSDVFRIESVINTRTKSSFGTDARWDTTYNMAESSPLTTNGDYLKYRLRLDFNQNTDQITITTTPLETNKNINLMAQQSIVWDAFANHDYTVGGNARAGIDVNHSTGLPLTKEQIKSTQVTVGSYSNGIVKSCEISQLFIAAYD